MESALKITPVIAFLTISGILISGLVFLLHGIRNNHKLTIDGFLLANRQLSGEAYANTYSATNISLASNIIFFIAAHQVYGWMMGLALIAYTIVQFYILYIVRKLNLDFNKIRTISDLWYEVFPSKKIARIITFTVVTGCFIGLFLELYFGSVILSIFFPDMIIYQAGSFLVLGFMVIAYVYLGGYNTIVKTDKWQVGLLILATLALGYFAATVPAIGSATETSFVQKISGHTESGLSLIVFLFWVCSLNVFLCFIDISTWQRMGASKSIGEASRGLFKGLWKIAVIFWGPMMAIVFIGAKGYSFNSLPEFFNVIYQYSGNLNYIIFPLVAIGFAAALFSTADTILISTMYGMCDQNSFLPHLEKFPKEQQHSKLKHYLSQFTAIIVSLLTIFYYIQGNDGIASYIMPLIYASWGVLIGMAIFPMIAFYRMWYDLPKINVSRISEYTIIATLIVAASITIIGSFFEYNTDDMIYSQIANLLTVLVVGAGIKLAFLLNDKVSINAANITATN